MTRGSNKSQSSGKQTTLPFVSPNKKGGDVTPETTNVNAEDNEEVIPSLPEDDATADVTQDEQQCATVLDQTEKERARAMLMEHINRSKDGQMNEGDSNQDEGYQSDDTNAASNTSTLWKKVFSRNDPKIQQVEKDCRSVSEQAIFQERKSDI